MTFGTGPAPAQLGQVVLALLATAAVAPFVLRRLRETAEQRARRAFMRSAEDAGRRVIRREVVW